MIRRAVLARLLGGLAIAAPIGSPAAAAASVCRGGPDGLLQGLTGDVALARELGRRYLSSRPSAAGLAAARARLTGPAAVGGGALRAAIAAAAADDLAAGDVVVVAGWVLARAEAETLALIALT
jgi:hypothetical protein